MTRGLNFILLQSVQILRVGADSATSKLNLQVKFKKKKYERTSNFSFSLIFLTLKKTKVTLAADWATLNEIKKNVLKIKRNKNLIKIFKIFVLVVLVFFSKIFLFKE